MTSKPSFKGLSIWIPIKQRVKGRGFINVGFGLVGDFVGE